jgi:vacuolar-type H+-ATPase subunit I/STV1
MAADLTTHSEPPHRWSRPLTSFSVMFTFVAAAVVGSSPEVASGAPVANGATDEAFHSGPVVGAELAALSGWVSLAAIVIVVGVFAVLLGPRVIAVRDRREISWLDAVAKSAVIVVGLIVLVVIVPAKALEIGTVQNMSHAAQDLIAVGLWSGGLAVGLVALWWAHRGRRI